MSLVTLFTKTAPTLGGIEFDAVLEDTLELDIERTRYPIEVGALAVDHRIIQPFRWSITGAVSNNPISVSATDFVGALSNFSGNGLAATAIGLSAGFLSGGDNTRAGSALEFLISLATGNETFDIDAGDIQLKNMSVVNITRTKTATNEGALIFTAQLEELTELGTLLSSLNPNQSQLLDGDPSQSQAAESIDKGEQGLQPVSSSNTLSVEAVTG